LFAVAVVMIGVPVLWRWIITYNAKFVMSVNVFGPDVESKWSAIINRLESTGTFLFAEYRHKALRWSILLLGMKFGTMIVTTVAGRFAGPLMIALPLLDFTLAGLTGYLRPYTWWANTVVDTGLNICNGIFDFLPLMAYFGVDIPESALIPVSVIFFLIPVGAGVFLFFIVDQPLRDDDPTVIVELDEEERGRRAQIVDERRGAVAKAKKRRKGSIGGRQIDETVMDEQLANMAGQNVIAVAADLAATRFEDGRQTDADGADAPPVNFSAAADPAPPDFDSQPAAPPEWFDAQLDDLAPMLTGADEMAGPETQWETSSDEAEEFHLADLEGKRTAGDLPEMTSDDYEEEEEAIEQLFEDIQEDAAAQFDEDRVELRPSWLAPIQVMLERQKGKRPAEPPKNVTLDAVFEKDDPAEPLLPKGGEADEEQEETFLVDKTILAKRFNQMYKMLDLVLDGATFERLLAMLNAVVQFAALAFGWYLGVQTTYVELDDLVDELICA
jgi:hypothetical protein